MISYIGREKSVRVCTGDRNLDLNSGSATSWVLSVSYLTSLSSSFLASRVIVRTKSE